MEIPDASHSYKTRFKTVPVEGLHTALCLVRDHASDGPPEDLAGGPEMEGSVARVGVHPLAEESEVLQLVTVEGS